MRDRQSHNVRVSNGLAQMVCGLGILKAPRRSADSELLEPIGENQVPIHEAGLGNGNEYRIQTWLSQPDHTTALFRFRNRLTLVRVLAAQVRYAHRSSIKSDGVLRESSIVLWYW